MKDTPVGYFLYDQQAEEWEETYAGSLNSIPLYKHPPQTKLLSIDEAVSIFESVACKETYKMKEGIQAVLDAIEAKVRGQ